VEGRAVDCWRADRYDRTLRRQISSYMQWFDRYQYWSYSTKLL